MNDNTILRIKVPAHLYESVKEQLTLTEAKKAGHNLGAGMELVKEKKMKAPKDGMQKVEETKENNEEMKKDQSLEEMKAHKAELEKKIEEMEMASKKSEMNEAVDPNLIAGIIGILFGSLPILYQLIKDYRSAKTPEEKKAVFSKAADVINKKMSGGM